MFKTKFLIPNSEKISFDEIIKFEKASNIILSDEYKYFLTVYNGGKPSENNILIKRFLKESAIHESFLGDFYSLVSVEKDYNYFYIDFPEEEIKDNSIITIGETNGVTKICIGISEKNLGQIYLWDWDFGVTRQANDLQMFFDSLVLNENT